MKAIISPLLFAFLCALSVHLQASTVLPLALDSLYDDAQLVFYGKCISNSTSQELATGLTVTHTSFQITESLKGQAGQTHTIKQLGDDESFAVGSFIVSGVPRFEVGREYIVFLPAASQLGFSSPVGLEQGKFNVSVSASDKKMVSNGRPFNELLNGISLTANGMAATTGPNSHAQKKVIGPTPPQKKVLPLQEFLSIVRKLGGGQ